MKSPYAIHGLTAAARHACLHRAAAAAVAALAVAHTQVHAQSQPLDCMIQPSQVVLVGSAVPGVVDHIAVERGDMVSRGQVLVQLQAQVERAALGVARERAGQVGEAVVARSAQQLARSELERAREMYTQEFVSKAYLDKQTAEALVAGGRTEQAGERTRLANREVQLAQAQLAQRTIRAPLSGVVVERLAAPGELVDQKPLLRIASIDPLRVDVLVPAAAFGQIEPGRKASVVPELFNRSTHEAMVKTVDRVVDAASNTFRVRLELPNPRGELPAGLRCKVDLALTLPDTHLAAPSAATKRAGSAQPAGLKPASAPALALTLTTMLGAATAPSPARTSGHSAATTTAAALRPR